MRFSRIFRLCAVAIKIGIALVKHLNLKFK
uniref:Uncharacterized protein n=1 Tax=Anguilla anguilla TaxID=7936 RepID=A0A0E9RBE7_ANGAN